jgi:hypothetical protein
VFARLQKGCIGTREMDKNISVTRSEQCCGAKIIYFGSGSEQDFVRNINKYLF